MKEKLRRIVYTKGREATVWSMHGLEFKKGVVYTVEDDVFEYLKAFSGFCEIVDIKLNPMSFKKVKQVRGI